MISREIINFVSEKAKVRQKSLIEKDLLLHRLLVELSSNAHFSGNYAFKGDVPDKMLSWLLQVL